MITKRISPNGLALIKEFEGLRLKAYYCPARILTIGYGHVIRFTDNLKFGDKISLDRTNDFLLNDLKWAEDAVNDLVKANINQSQFDALVSFTFNLGQTTFGKSTLLKLINNAQPEKAANFLLKYCYANGKQLSGLLRRRNAERKLFLSEG